MAVLPLHTKQLLLGKNLIVDMQYQEKINCYAKGCENNQPNLRNKWHHSIIK